MGYWTSENMNKLVKELIELFDFLYPDHTMLLNIDWSANHNAMAPDARMLTNMRVRAGGERTRDAEVEQMPVFEKYKLTEKDIGHNVPAEWEPFVQEGKWFHFDFKDGQLPFYDLQKGQTREDILGKAIGKRETAYRLGWWRPGMTEKGKTAAVEATRKAPRKYQYGDLVARKEPKEGDPANFCFHLYKVIEVPLAHNDASSAKDIIRCQWFEPIGGVGSERFKITNKVWDDDTYRANTMMWVDPSMVQITSGKIQNKSKCELEFDLNAYCNTFFEEQDDNAAELEEEEEEEDDKVDFTSLDSVLGHLPMFHETKSMLEVIVEKSNHKLLLSSKYHAEVAGQGIEYCFGRAKWWYKKYNVAGSAATLRELSRKAFESSVVTKDHARKFARKARDYQRIYRAGVKGLAAESTIKVCKTHRCALDTHYKLVSE